jgi:hypothetical protein
MLLQRFFVLLVCGTLIVPVVAFADGDVVGVFRDFVVVQKESAEAKKVRLEWINTERNRISDELSKFNNELAELEKIIPRPVQPRVLSRAQSENRQQEEKRFKDWSANQNPERKGAIFEGSALNALLRVLAPIAHYRKTRTHNASASGVFPCLVPANNLNAEDWKHLRMNPANTSGVKVEVLLNQLPLQIDWPVVLIERFKPECDSLLKTRDAFVVSLSPGNDVKARLEHAEVLDKSLALLQAKIQKEKGVVLRDHSVDSTRRNKMHTDLFRSLDYISSLRATVERLKEVPSEYKKLEFAGGTIEEFLDFCYLNDLVFLPAKPIDQPYYSKVYRSVKDYAHDVQYVEDWRDAVNRRIGELSAEDQKLVFRASVE